VRRAVLGLAVAYPLALLAVLLAMRSIGERWWLTTVVLYLPPVGFGLPLPVSALALIFVGARRWLRTQVAAALLLLFPLMGLSVHGPRAPADGAVRLRVMSCNIDLSSASADALAGAIRASDADVICLQEARGDEVGPLRERLPAYTVRGDGQFIIASKYRISDVYLPPDVPWGTMEHRPNFVRYRIEAPGGTVDVYNIHPVSPHGSFDRLRGVGLLHELASGRFFSNHEGFRKVELNAELRATQARAIAANAAASPYDVVIAGDTNLPSSSWILRTLLGAYRDGFAEVGRGFGYTFPARKRAGWLRLDRILAGGRFRFLSFAPVDVRVSTHFPVVADLERPPAPKDGATDTSPRRP
jgi:vancomycin resistance protein VanJ